MKTFFVRVFCETDGTPSFARVCTAVLVAFALGWVTALVRANHAMPDMAGLALFISAVYGANKFATAVSKD